MSLLDRLDEIIDEVSGGNDEKCWLWPYYRHERGYGRIGVRGKVRFVHRVVYERKCGPVPEGCELDHLCRNKACFNPKHLEPVSHRENVMRGNGVAAKHAQKTHCKHGHEFTPENTRIRERPGHGIGIERICVACAEKYNKRRSTPPQ